MTEIICSGFGGQGVLVAGLILADAGMEQDKKVTWYPSYGSEMRGGTANCNVKISDDEIASPYCNELDILYTLSETAIDKFEKQIKSGGILLVNSTLTKKTRQYRDDIRVIKIPATATALALNSPRGTNVIMLGALAAASEDFDVDYMRSAVDHYFAKKGKFNKSNAICFDKGVEAALAQV